ncbi:MAG: acyl-CoA dehydrogenase family protein, partial [Fimbriimonadaceae bacterium]|nr:acyl-CoA dehydrogenase family protein [Alphaproteobacteria bacterium]
MNIEFTADEIAFQKHVRQTLAAKFPRDISDKVRLGQSLSKGDFVRSQKILHELGWATVNWPEEYGGPGWTPTQRYIFENEMADAFVPRIVPFGINMVAPVIYTFGSDKQ